MNEKNSLHIWKTWVALCALVIAPFLVGCVTLDDPPETERPTPTERTNTFNTLQPGEMVKIDFSGPASPPQPHEENIKDDGTISLIHIGSVKAAGKTPGQLQSEIQQLYVPRFYKYLNVTVKPADRFFIVGGQVNAPSRQLYLGPITVTGAIKASGDFTDFARKNKVRLIRADGTIHIIDAIKAQENPKLDLPVYPGDKIDVPSRWY